MKKKAVKIDEALLIEIVNSLAAYDMTRQNMVKFCLEAGVEYIRKHGIKARYRPYKHQENDGSDQNQHPVSAAREKTEKERVKNEKLAQDKAERAKGSQDIMSDISPEARFAQPREDGKTPAQVEAEMLEYLNSM